MSCRGFPLRSVPCLSIFSSSGHDRWGSLHGAWGSPVRKRQEAILRRSVAALGIVVVAAACSGSVDSSDSTVTDLTQTTEIIASSSASPTTSMSTTTPETTAPESTPNSESPESTDEPVDAETVIRSTLDQTFNDFSECLTSMPECDPTVLETTRAGELLATNVARIEEWNAAGYTVIDRDQFRFVVEAVELDDDETTATATACIADGSKLINPGAGPEGADVIIDDTFVSGREAWEMRLDDDVQWRAYSAPAVGATEESDTCPAA